VVGATRGRRRDSRHVAPIDIAALPDDVSALCGVIGALMNDLSAERPARQMAEAGLPDKVLEAEHLRM